MSKGTKAKNGKETERDKERGKVMNGKGERQGKWEERRQNKHKLLSVLGRQESGCCLIKG